MAHERTIDEVAEMAQQAELVCRLLEDYPHELTDVDVSSVATLVKKLSGDVAAWLIEEIAIRGGAHNV